MGDDMADTEAVQATNDDASSCKACAVRLHYWPDPYIQLFCRPISQRAPEINRGYFARTQAFRALVDRFCKATGGQGQIINFGAGFDTLYFRLLDEGTRPMKFVEIDLPHTVGRKVHIVTSKKPLLDRIKGEDTEISHNRSELHADPYHIISSDLRKSEDLLSRLQSTCGIDLTAPTLFLSECVLVYLPSSDSAALLRRIADSFPRAAFVHYEQVNMSDRFGQVMVNNLQARKCKLSGVDACASMDSQEKRFTDNGWKQAKAWTMNQVYESFPQATIKRIERLEPLDEREVMQQLFEHYCVVYATTESQMLDLPSSLTSVFEHIS